MKVEHGSDEGRDASNLIVCGTLARSSCSYNLVPSIMLPLQVHSATPIFHENWIFVFQLLD